MLRPLRSYLTTFRDGCLRVGSMGLFEKRRTGRYTGGKWIVLPWGRLKLKPGSCSCTIAFIISRLHSVSLQQTWGNVALTDNSSDVAERDSSLSGIYSGLPD